MRPFRFALQLSSPIPGLSWPETARRVEAAGFDSLLVADHFADQWGPIVAMTAAAMATTELSVGCLVFDNDYRHPAVLAKEMASLASLAPGRVEVGLGAGWMKWDYERIGMPLDPPGVRVGRFIEGFHVLRQFFAGGEVFGDGEHYQIGGLPGSPVAPMPPRLMVGGGGPRMLKFAARNADIVAVTARIPSGEVDSAALLDSAPAAVDEKIAWVRDAAGDRLADIDLNCLVFLAQVTDDPEGVATAVAAMLGGSAPIERGVGATLRHAADEAGGDHVDATAAPATLGQADVMASPAVLLGTKESIIEQLLARRERWGFNYIAMQGADVIEAFAPIVSALRGQ